MIKIYHIGYTVELVSPKPEKFVMANPIRTYKNAPCHICCETDDINASAEQLRIKGFLPMESPASALGNHPVLFLMNAQIEIIELLGGG